MPAEIKVSSQIYKIWDFTQFWESCSHTVFLLIPTVFIYQIFSQPGEKNRINGTQRTEQSEVYGTKKEEKREKRRKLV